MDKQGKNSVLLAVNGTLMRGLELEQNLLDVGAEFAFESKTADCYRLWSIRDQNPAMIRVAPGELPSAKIDVEVWRVPAEGLAAVLLKEPEGLSVGKVMLEDGQMVLGVIGEPVLVKGMKEITEYGGWRSYIKHIKVE
ncbi:MAG: glutamyl-tRNA amidotransferase [Lachnospiraceae bacterium]|nr:glutamyl-tRNA amidotransferase [Lachnospiraceae bacterium]